MTIRVYAFAEHSDLIDNRLNTLSTVGELSSEAYTYSKDRQYYTNSSYPGARLTVFKAINSETNQHNDLAPENVNHAIELATWIKNKALLATFTKITITNLQIVSSEFSHLKNIRLGIPTEFDGKFIPSSIIYSIEINSVEHEFTIWFTDNAFRQQYKFYDIIAVSPIQEVDEFFNNERYIKNLKDSINLPQIHRRLELERAGLPCTKIESYEYKWVSGTTEIPIPWTVVIYGNVAGNMDIIRQEITKMILAASQRGRAEWEKIFPDLFVPTEFMLIPSWENISIPGYRLVESIFSPILKHKDSVALFKSRVPNYEEEHIKEWLEVLPTLYKSVSVLACGSPSNRLAPKSLYAHMGNYALIGSRTDDFNRMDKRTQLFVNMLTSLLKHADELTPTYRLPAGYVRTERNGQLYISTSYEDVQYLIAIRDVEGNKG